MWEKMIYINPNLTVQQLTDVSLLPIRSNVTKKRLQLRYKSKKQH